MLLWNPTARAEPGRRRGLLGLLLLFAVLSCGRTLSSEPDASTSEPHRPAMEASTHEPSAREEPAAPLPPASSPAPLPVPLPVVVATDPTAKWILYLRNGDLCMARQDRTEETLLVRGDGAASLDGDGELPLKDFYNIEFHPDGVRVLFSVRNGRGEAIGAVHLLTKEVRWLAAAYGHEHVVIPRGPHKGHLLLYKHRYNYGPEGGSYDVCVLANGWTGEEIRDMTLVDRDCVASPAMKRALRF